MFTDAHYVAARVRDAARWLNEALMHANETGVTFSVKVEQRQPIVIKVEEHQSKADGQVTDPAEDWLDRP